MELIPTLHDVYGWAAALLTLLAFSCKNMLRLRYVALAANAAFIAYGFAAQLWPVLALHAVLVPINLWRLRQAMRPVPLSSGRSPAIPLAHPSTISDRPA